jgi:hypothetical protein
MGIPDVDVMKADWQLAQEEAADEHRPRLVI